MTKKPTVKKKRLSVCVRCGRKIGVYVPKGGDGSLVAYRRHNNNHKFWCEGSGRVVPNY